jgi:tRNA A-37 threonylcarbamoyl transferase component Bud32/tetratricopeptide (TPR) repeat protein
VGTEGPEKTVDEDRDLITTAAKDSSRSPALLPARYEITGIIAQGGMGKVYLARDLQLGRLVAIKVLLFEGYRDERLQARFAREAKILASLNHDKIVKLLSWGVNESGNPYQVMEYLEGSTLAAEIGGGKRLDSGCFQPIFSGVLAGLAHAHAAGIVHRDIKPGNIILCREEEEICPKIVDFGIARLQSGDPGDESRLTQTGHLLGSPAYMSPEQCRGGQVNHLTDIYSLACIMFEAITGYPPHQAESDMELMYRQMSVDAPSLEAQFSGTAAASLGRLVDVCLSRDPHARPQSAAEVAGRLNQIFESNEGARKLFAAGPARPVRKLSTPLIALAALLAVVAGFSVVLPGFKAHDAAMQKDNATAPLLRRGDDLERRVLRLESEYLRAQNPNEKNRAAENLVTRIMELAQNQSRLHEFRNAETSLEKALKYSQNAYDPRAWKANICLELGACKLVQMDSRSAEKAFLEGLKYLPRSAEGRILKDGHTGLATRLSQNLALLQIQEHRFEDAGDSLSLLMKSEYHRRLLEKKFAPVAEEQGPPLVYEISNCLATVSLQGVEEEMAALRLYDQIGEYLLRKGSPEAQSAGAGETVRRALALVRKIPAQTPGFRPLAARTYRMASGFEDLNKNKKAADQYEMTARSFSN